MKRTDATERATVRTRFQSVQSLAAVRHAITLDPREVKRMLALFKRLLFRDLSIPI